MVNLRELEIVTKSEEGARIRFEELITQLVKIRHLSATQIRAAPGDWGIDCIAGTLSSGSSYIWQAKYFINGVGKSQQQQIRESFQQLNKKSKEYGFTVDVWTLCIPCSLSPEELKWWDGWKKRLEKDSGINIQLMDKTDIIKLLISPEASSILREFFPHHSKTIEEAEVELEQLPDITIYDNSIFIKKLEDAGFSETFAAKTQFFNAELYKAEIQGKGDEVEKQELRELYLKIHSLWEPRFNTAKLSINPDRNIPLVYLEMCKEIEEQNFSLLRTNRIKPSFIHKAGFMHQLSDKCEIGWTIDFKRYNDGNS